MVVVSSGLHGVEGYFGSAVQLALLEGEDVVRGHCRSGVALVLIHALNPYGFAWVRRANEENVDLNRNFLLTGESYKGSPPRYAALDALLNPKHPPHRLDTFRLRSMVSILRHGMPQLNATSGMLLMTSTISPSTAAALLAKSSCKGLPAAAK